MLRRMRSLILLLSGVFWAGSAHAACDMDIAARSIATDQYVLAGQACLETPPAQYRFDDTMERAFIDRINDARKAEGLKPLKRRADLRAPARFRVCVCLCLRVCLYAFVMSSLALPTVSRDHLRSNMPPKNRPT